LNLTEDQILTLAPDEASKKSGRDLANPSKWVSKAANDEAIWGECQGSGSKPYQTQIDVSNIAFKCSCPSHKFPCKHGLALLLLYARQKNSFAKTDSPNWVAEWLSKRTEKQEKKVTKEDTPVDEVAQAKRLQARQQKVSDGISDLRLWLKDIVRNGILNMPEKGTIWFENMAKRMVDAQAPGLANMIRALGETNFYAEDWQTDFTNQLISIYLIAEGYNQKDSLSDLLKQDIFNQIGFTQNQEELKAKTGIQDTWLVLAKQITEVDALTTERNWLYGTETGQYALVLQFIVRGQGGQLTLTPGMFIRAELVFFPSTSPIRAILKQQPATTAINKVNGFPGWAEIAETEACICSELPVRSDRPFIIQKVKPVKYNNHWWLQDSNYNMMRMKHENKIIWKLLSLSGGTAIDMTVIGKEDQFEPVGVWHNHEYIIL